MDVGFDAWRAVGAVECGGVPAVGVGVVTAGGLRAVRPGGPSPRASLAVPADLPAAIDAIGHASAKVNLMHLCCVRGALAVEGALFLGWAALNHRNGCPTADAETAPSLVLLKFVYFLVLYVAHWGLAPRLQAAVTDEWVVYALRFPRMPWPCWMHTLVFCTDVCVTHV